MMRAESNAVGPQGSGDPMQHSHVEATVRKALSRYLDVEPTALNAADRLDEDLDMTTLDVVLVVLHVEDVYGHELDISLMESVRTVSELVLFVERQQREGVAYPRRERLSLAG